MTESPNPTNIELLLEHLEEGSLARALVEAYRDSEEGSRVASLNECLDARLFVIRGSLVAADDEEAADAD